MNLLKINPFDRTSDLLNYTSFDLERISQKILKIFKYLEYTGHVTVHGVEVCFKPRATKFYRLYQTQTFSVKVSCTVAEKPKVFTVYLPLMVNRKFLINGYENVPVFQIVDPPIVSYPAEGGGTIFVRSAFNDLSLVYKNNRCRAYIFKKRILLSTLLFAVNGFQETCKHFGAKIVKRAMKPNELKSGKMVFKDTCFEVTNLAELSPIGQLIFTTACAETNRDVMEEFGTREYFIALLGWYFFDKRNFKKKGLEILESLKTSFFDPITSEQLKYEGDFFKLVLQIFEDYKPTGHLDTLDLTNRIFRLEDYLLTPLFHKVFSIVRTSMKYTQRTHHIKIKPDEILSVLPKPDLQPLVQYDSSVNPIGEVASFFKCSVFGIDGLQKDQVSITMRNLHPSYFGILCPIDTPDGKTCGVVTNLTPTAPINLETGRVTVMPQGETRDIVSLPVATIPFLENNDGVRLQMGANQSEQAKILDDPELPWIQTGAEHVVARLSTFTKRSPCDGTVVFINNDFIVIKDAAGKAHIVDVKTEFTRRQLFKEYVPAVKMKAQVKTNDIVAYDVHSIKDEKVALGKNLKACFFCYEGYTYEDAIVISETASQKLCHWEYDVTELLLEPNQTLRKLDSGYVPKAGTVTTQEVIAEKCTITNSPEILFDFDREFDQIGLPVGSEILRVEAFVNTAPDLDPELKDYVDELCHQQICEEQAQYNVVKRFVDDPEVLQTYNKELLKSNRIGKFYTNLHYEGVLFRIYSRKKYPLVLGDKLANRAGNKGVVSLILPDDKMPKDEEGTPFEVCLNPMGVITRMNVGQLFELTLSTACKHVTDTMKKLSVSKALKYLLGFVALVDNTENKSYSTDAKQMIAAMTPEQQKVYYQKVIAEGVTIYQPPFQSIALNKYLQLITRLELKEKQYLYLPKYDKQTSEPVACGFMFMMKLLHTSDSKIHARSTGPYSQITGQPLQGKRNQGAQRLGEMEIWALAAHDATAVLREILTIKSDDIKGRKSMARSFLEATPISASLESSPLSRDIFFAYLKGLMLNLKEIPDEGTNAD